MNAVHVVTLIKEVGWPAAQYLLERYHSKDQEFSEADFARLSALVRIPASEYEKAIVPLPPRS